MTKRFKEVYPDIIESSYEFTDNGKGITHKEVVDLLNMQEGEIDFCHRVINTLLGQFDETDPFKLMRIVCDDDVIEEEDIDDEVV